MTRIKQVFIYAIIGLAWAGVIVGLADLHSNLTWVHPEERGSK